MNRVILVHGWVYSTEKWQAVVAELITYGISIEILAIPGLTAPLEQPWTLDHYVQWLYLEVQVSNKPVVLIGHSNGGRIALAFALAYPHLVHQLVVIDAAGIMHRGLRVSAKRIIFGSATAVGKRFTSSDKLRKIVYKLAREGDYQQANPVMRKTMTNLLSVDLAPRLSEITNSTLLIWGDLDKSTPLADGKLMKKCIPNSRLVIISGANHSPHASNPGEVAHAIAEFIQ